MLTELSMVSRRSCLSLVILGVGAAILPTVNAREPRPIFPRRPKDPSPGNLVKQVQVELRGKGFDPGPIDGIYGRKTSRAIMNYQQWRGIPVTGVVSTELLNLYLKDK